MDRYEKKIRFESLIIVYEKEYINLYDLKI